MLEKEGSGEKGSVGAFLTIKQMARRLQITEKTVYRHWREFGGFKVGGAIRFEWEPTRDRLLKKAKEEGSILLPIHQGWRISPGRGISHPSRREGGRGRRANVLKLVPDRHNLWGGMPEVSRSLKDKKFRDGERR
jgi:hypothetical protein